MLLALAGLELEHPRLCEPLALDVLQNDVGGLVVGPVLAAEHEAIAHPVLQRDTPLPAGLPCDGPRVGNRRPDRLGLHRHGTVAGQPVRVVVVTGLQRLLDQQPPEPGAVDEQVTVDALAGVHDQCRHVAAFRVLFDAVDLAFLPDNAGFLRHLAQLLGVERRVDVVRVVQALIR